MLKDLTTLCFIKINAVQLLTRATSPTRPLLIITNILRNQTDIATFLNFLQGLIAGSRYAYTFLLSAPEQADNRKIMTYQTCFFHVFLEEKKLMWQARKPLV